MPTTNISLVEIFNPGLTSNPEIAPFLELKDRFDFEITLIPYKRDIPKLLKLLEKNKWTGKSSAMFPNVRNVGDIKLANIKITDTGLPLAVRDKSASIFSVNWADTPNATDVTKLKAYLESTLEEIEVERQTKSAIASKEELELKGEVGVETSTTDLTLPIELGTYSEADKAFFKWFCKDENGNKYLRSKDGKDAILIPIEEGSNPQVSLGNTNFWTFFFKNYRDDIIVISRKVSKLLWDLATKSSEAADKDDLRSDPIVTEDGDFSALQAIHAFCPKAIMSRLGATYTYKYIHDKTDNGSSRRILNEIHTVVKKSAFGSFKKADETLWAEALAGIIPRLDDSEFETIERYRDDSYGLAIHRINAEMFKADLPQTISEVQMMPNTWKKFFEKRLGDQKFSSLYRIAKWMVGVVDANNFSRKILVIAGHGCDGKSLFLNTIRKGFNQLGGKGFAVELNSDAVTVDNNTQNGLLECMDARVITSSDIRKVTEFINADTIKNITGGDIVTTNVKYRNPVSKNMRGTKMIVCTNYMTYLSDSFVETRVSPICFFHVREAGEADWDPIEMQNLLLGEFSEFIRWCFEFAYAVECERNIPHNGDQPLWSDGVTDGSPRSQWEAVGCTSRDSGMFKYRTADANAEILEEDIRGYIDDLFFKSNDEKVKVCVVRTLVGNSLGIKFRDVGADKRWNLVSKIIQDHFGIEAPVKSNGIRIFKGIGAKDVPNSDMNRVSARHMRGSLRPQLETTIPH